MYNIQCRGLGNTACNGVCAAVASGATSPWQRLRALVRGGQGPAGYLLTFLHLYTLIIRLIMMHFHISVLEC